MARIHASAIVDAAAELDSDVTIGPFCVIGGDVSIGAGSNVISHTLIEGRTHIGRNNRIASHCAIGGPPQDKKYAGEDTLLEIGDGNSIFDNCTFSRGTAQGGGVTRIGSNNWIMAYAHVAHDCHVGNETILANNATLAGHVSVGDWAILGGLTAVHQFVRIGPHAMTAGGSIVLRDVPPFVVCSGNPAEPHGINTEGLRRRGFEGDDINALRRAYKTIYRQGLSVTEAIATLMKPGEGQDVVGPHLLQLIDFLQNSPRGIVR